MKLPPSASPGANAIACRAPSTPPQRCLSSPTSVSKSSGLFTSSSSTSGGSGSRAAARSVIRRVRPKPVSTTCGALLLGALGDRVGDAALRQHARDEQALAVEHQAAPDQLDRRAHREPAVPGSRSAVVPRPGPAPSSSSRVRAISPSTCTVSPIFTGCLKTASPTRRRATTARGRAAAGRRRRRARAGRARSARRSGSPPPTRDRCAAGGRRRSGRRTRGCPPR